MPLKQVAGRNQQTSEGVERLLFPDVLRVVAIFAVIVIHVSATQFYKSPVMSYNWQVTNFFECLVRWGVPVFVMVSGMFFLNPEKEMTLTKLYHKNVFRLVVALISWGILYRSFHVVKIVIADKMDLQTVLFTMLKEYSHLIFGPVWYHLWFLYMIISLYFLVPIFRVFTKNATDKQYRYLFMIFIFFGSILPFIKDLLMLFDDRLKINFKIAEFTGYACYFILGYYLSKKELASKTKKWIYCLALISVLFQILGTFGVSYLQESGHELLYENSRPNVLIQPVAIFVFIKDISARINFSERTKSIIFALSKYSFGIYLVHDFFNIIFGKIGFTTICINPMLAIPLRSVITFVLSFCVIWILGRIPIIKKYCM